MDRKANAKFTEHSYESIGRQDKTALIMRHYSKENLTSRRNPGRHLKKAEELREEIIQFVGDNKLAHERVKAIGSMLEGNYDLANFHSEGTGAVFVKVGKKPIMDGIRVVFTHTDSPCVQIKPRPIRIEWDEEKKDLRLGIQMHGFAYGGIGPHHYMGKRLEVRGWADVGDKRKEISLPNDVWISDYAQHTDDRVADDDSWGEATLEDPNLILETGYGNHKKILKDLGLKNLDDFARSALFAVPKGTPSRVGENFLAGYGFDNALTAVLAAKAFKDLKKPEYTTIFYAPSLEEIGGFGPAGGSSHLFERTLDNLLLETNTVERIEDISEASIRRMYDRSLIIAADGDAAGMAKDEKKESIDELNIPAIGKGPFINASTGLFDGDQISTRLVARLDDLFDEKKIWHQLTGPAIPDDGSSGLATMGDQFFKIRGVDNTINVGPVIAAMHAHDEVVSWSDAYETLRAYEAIMNDRTKIGGNEKMILGSKLTANRKSKKK
jgi:aspartyl aminopeptidase